MDLSGLPASMTSATHLRLGGLAALGFVLLTLFAALVPHEPLPETAPAPADVTAFFERNAAMQAAQPFTKILAAFSLLGFATVLAMRLREAGAPLAAAATLACGAVFAGVLIALMIFVASIVTLAPVLDGGVVFVLYNVAWIANVRSGLGAVPFLLAAGIGLLRSRALPRGVAYGAFAAAAVGLAGGAVAVAAPGPAGIGPAFMGFLGVVAWVLASGITLLVQASRVGAPQTAATAAMSLR